jgi:D-serine deaminase-like pyridoxal phosphate-dependent protein
MDKGGATGFEALRTPRLLLDLDRLRANIARMAAAGRAASLPLRVHLKTVKCAEAVDLLRAEGIDRFAVSTMAEAEFFAARGDTDLLYTTPITPAKVADMLALGPGAMAAVECLPMARLIDAAARAAGGRLPVLIELDVDGNRGGVPFPGPDFDELAAFIAGAEGLILRGVMTYSGATYREAEAGAREGVATAHDRALGLARAALAALGVADPILSTGGSPGVLACATHDGPTELRPGVFVFWDLYQMGLGVCGLDDIAVSVLATVLSVRPERGQALTDAGALALSLDRSTGRQAVDWGFGRVCDADGRPIGSLKVGGTAQEHGIVTGSPEEIARLTPGQLVRVLPNHCCITAAAYPEYDLIGGGRLTGARWTRVNFW